jgi:acetoin utilization deacetylase AcuC-like enzyme
MLCGGWQFKKILKKLQARRPHVLVWCFGADNHAFDDGASPAGVGGLHSKDQADLARWIRKALPWLRIVVVQEGGYAVQGRSAGSLPRSVYAVVSRFLFFLVLFFILLACKARGASH